VSDSCGKHLEIERAKVSLFIAVHRLENGVASMNTYAQREAEDRRSRAHGPSGMRHDAHSNQRSKLS
jgi:hypothetical protein